MAVSITESQVNRYIEQKYGNIREARRQTGIQSISLIKAQAARELSQQRGDTGAQARNAERLAQMYEGKAGQAAQQARSQAVATYQQIQERKERARVESLSRTQIISEVASGRISAQAAREEIFRRDPTARETEKAILSQGIKVTKPAREVSLSVLPDTLASKYVVGAPTIKAKQQESIISQPAPIPQQGREFYKETMTEFSIITSSAPRDNRPVISGGLAIRAEQQKAREEKIGAFYQQVYAKTGLTKNEQATGFIGGTVETGKALGRGILGFPGSAFIVGGRAMFLGEVAVRGSLEARYEIVRAAQETPRAIARSYDPKTPEGRANIFLTAIAVKTTAKSIQVARAKPITAEKLTTARFSSKQQTLDRTAILAQSRAAGKTISIKGQAYQVIKTKGELGVLKGVGKFKTSMGKTLTVSQKGFGRKGDFVVVTKIAQKGKVQTYVDTLRTRQIAGTPTQELRTVAFSAPLKKGQTISQLRPATGSMSRSVEVMSKTFYTESGATLGKTQILQTGRLDLPIQQGQLAQLYSQQIHAAALPSAKPSALFSGAGKTQTVLETPSGSLAIQTAVKNILSAEQTAALSIQAQSGASASAASLLSTKQESPLNIQAVKPSTVTVTKLEKISSPKPIQQAKPIQATKPKQETTPLIKVASAAKSKTTLIQKSTSRVEPVAKQLQKATQLTRARQALKVSQALQPSSPGFSPPVPGPLIPRGFGMGTLKLKLGVDRKQAAPSFFQRKGRYTPTLYASALNVFGKPSKIGVETGLGLRPVSKKKRTRGLL